MAIQFDEVIRMNEYWTHNKQGEYITVYDLDKCLSAIKQRHEDQESQIKYLSQENKKLKDEHYKDEEIQNLKNQIKKLEQDSRRGFLISEKEWNAIEKWQNEHDTNVHRLDSLDKKLSAGGAIGGRYSYHFVPTSIGTIGTVKCSCGTEFTFQEL